MRATAIGRREAFHATAASLLASVIVHPASAQSNNVTPPVPASSEATANAVDIGDIIVTAQKRAQNIQDVAVAITALGGQTIKDIGHQDVAALVARVPGVQVQSISATSVFFNIRGVSQNDFADSQEAPIAFYNDEVYVSAVAAISGQNFDLERIEVLRGPQGTLFGRNATGGLIQYITAKPTGSLQGYATMTFGSYGEVASDAAISGPLSQNVRGRLSFSSDSYNGYIKNRIGPDVGSRRFYAGRAQIEADVGAGGLLRVKLQALRNDGETSSPYTWLPARPNADGLGVLAPGEADYFGYKEPDNDPFTASLNNVPRFRRTFASATVRYEQDLGGDVQLTSITDYQRLRKFYGEDSDVSPATELNYYQRQRLWQASEELRLSGKSDRLNWVAGVYGLLIDANAHAIFDGYFAQTFIVAGGPQKTKSFAVFGQSDYKLTDKLTLTLGARYSYDRKRDDFTHYMNGAIDLVFNPSVSNLAVQQYKNWSGKAALEFRPVRGVLLYVSANRGTKSGGFDIPNFPVTDANNNYVVSTIPYKQEVLTNYEGGFKITAFDRKVDFNASVFHYDYKDYQAFVFQNVTSYITNLPANVTGFEAEVNLRPTSGLTANAFVTYLNAIVHNVRLPLSGVLTDRQMPQAPRWSFGGNVSYAIPLGRGTMTPSTDWRYDGASYFSTFNAPIDLERQRVVGNGRVTYTVGRYSASFFVNNVTDRHFRVYDSDNSVIFGSSSSTYAHPRWFGGSLTYRY